MPVAADLNLMTLLLVAVLTPVLAVAAGAMSWLAHGRRSGVRIVVALASTMLCVLALTLPLAVLGSLDAPYLIAEEGYSRAEVLALTLLTPALILAPIHLGSVLLVWIPLASASIYVTVVRKSHPVYAAGVTVVSLLVGAGVYAAVAVAVGAATD